MEFRGRIASSISSGRRARKRTNDHNGVLRGKPRKRERLRDKRTLADGLRESRHGSR